MPTLLLLAEFRRAYAISEADFWQLTVREFALLAAGLQR